MTHSSFTLGRPRNPLTRLATKFGKKTHAEEVKTTAWKLSEQGRDRLEQALSSGTVEEQALEFSKAIRDLQTKEKIRPLNAAARLGLAHLDAQTDNPIIELTASVGLDEGAGVKGAAAFHLADLTDIMAEGAETFSQTPQLDPVKFAATVEGSIGYVADEMAPVLDKVRPGIASHINIYDSVIKAPWTSGLPNSSVLYHLADNPNQTLETTLAQSLDTDVKYGDNDSWGTVSERLRSVQDDAELNDDSAVKELASDALDILDKKGVDSLLNFLEK